MKIIYVIFALLFSNNLFCAPSEQEIKEFFTKLFAEIDAKKDNDNDFIQFYPYEKINKSDFKNVKLALKNKDLLEKLSNNDIHNYISYNFYNKKIISKNIINETKKRYKNNPNNDDCKYNIAIINYFNKNYLKAFIYLYDLAKKNYIRAQYSLSLIYKISYFFMPYSLTKMRLKEKNLIKSVKWFLKAKENNYQPSIEYLECIKFMKTKSNKNFLSLYKNIKNNKFLIKKNKIREIILSSKYGKFFIDKNNDISFKFNKGLYKYNQKKYVKSFMYFYDLAKNNHPQAQYFLAKTYKKAIIQANIIFCSKKESEEPIDFADKNTSKYQKYMNKSANNNYSPAKYKIGLQFEKDNNYTMALIYFIGAKNQPLAQLKAATYYENALGVEKDLLQSFFYYKKAAQYNNVEAYHKLYVIYTDGLGVPKNNSKALYCLKKFATSINNNHMLAVKYKSY